MQQQLRNPHGCNSSLLVQLVDTATAVYCIMSECINKVGDSSLLVQLVDEESVEEMALGKATQLAHLHIPLLLPQTSVS